jgi:hypothetical protein
LSLVWIAQAGSGPRASETSRWGYRQGGLIKDVILDWISVEVNDLLSDYADQGN